MNPQLAQQYFMVTSEQVAEYARLQQEYLRLHQEHTRVQQEQQLQQMSKREAYKAKRRAYMKDWRKAHPGYSTDYYRQVYAQDPTLATKVKYVIKPRT